VVSPEMKALWERAFWWKVRPGGMCPKCGEERLVTRVTDAQRDQHYCSVCSHSWPAGTKA
jgi:ssDNA-binding Zn-finger/Zn-ribbon topoisomerase 1